MTYRKLYGILSFEITSLVSSLYFLWWS